MIRLAKSVTLTLLLVFSADGLAQGTIESWTQEDGVLGLGYPVPMPVDTPLPFEGFRSYNGLFTRHQDLMITSDVVHGEVVGTTHNGREIWAYRLGDEDLLTWEGFPEAATLTNGGIHAREWQTPEVVTGIMELLVEQQGDHHYYDFILENVNVILLPVQNVDGFLQTQRYPSQNWLRTDPDYEEGDDFLSPRDGRMRRKNMPGVDEILSTQQDHLFGIDLNRNNPPLWATNPDRSSPDPESLVFHGSAPQSEPETQALLAAADLGPRDQLRAYTDVHSFSQVFYFHRTSNIRLSNNLVNLMFTMSNHNAALPGGSLYLFNSDPNLGIDEGFGMTNEFFTTSLEIPSWGVEVEPTQGQSAFPHNPPGCGADYGGLARNCHDGFILPESQIRRVREELARSFTAVYYQQAGPPSIVSVHFMHADTQAVVYEAEWDVVDGGLRELYQHQLQPLVLGENYTYWVTYDRPMRWRSSGSVVQFPGQPPSSLNISGGTFKDTVQLTSNLSNQRWVNTPGEGPDGYFRYQDDTFATEVSFPKAGLNFNQITDTETVNVRNGTWNMTGQQSDADPSTPVTWANGGWSGYENSTGVDGGDVGGIDSSYELLMTRNELPDPFVIEPGTSAAWFDPSHSGEGFVIEILENNQAVMYWFTYDENGEQAWYIAAGEVRGNRLLFPELIQTTGGVFGPDFDPSTVTNTVAGSASFLYETCDSGTMVYRFPGRKGRFKLQRLSLVMGADCGESTGTGVTGEAIQSGSWFNPQQDGHGFTVEVLADGRVLVYWFAYDQSGKQAWFFGVGAIEDGELVVADTLRTSGPKFGPDFNPDDLVTTHWGEMRFSLGCNSGMIDYDGTPSGFGAASIDLMRLSSLAGLGCTSD